MRYKSSTSCSSAGRVTAQLLLSFLALSTPISASDSTHQRQQQQQQPILPILPPLIPESDPGQDSAGNHVFSLRHVFHHGTYEYPQLHKQLDILDTKSKSTVWLESEDGKGPLQEVTRPLVMKKSPVKIERLKDRRPSVVDPMVAASRESGDVWALSPSAWTVDEIPDRTYRQDTIITLAQMAAKRLRDWKDVDGGFNRTDDYGFGWDADGLRGYIYMDESNSTIVIGLKGTSLAVYDGDGTTTNDKENDNLFFSCCCGQQGASFYRQVCDCATGTYTCNVSCLKKSLRSENRYYTAARHLYSNVTALYPNANVWMSGHSLGGSVSSMLGLTYGIPVVTFEAVPDALPVSRLGLPAPPGHNPSTPQKREFTGAYHFGHTADPIYLGTCNGATASCSYAGYALESSCHSGMECVYDVVADHGWGVHIWSHKIITVIEQIIKVYDTVPVCKFTPECVDCPLWKEVEGNSSSTATSAPSTSTTNTRSRTSTCKTPGWWGCLDEDASTTSKPTTSVPVTTTSTSTSTCKTPGWFGCKDEKTTTKSSSTSVPHTPTSTSSTTSTTATTTCEHPGWFGCKDPTSTSTSVSVSSTKDSSHSITSAPPLPSPTTSTPSTTTQTCTSKNWFGFVCVDPSPDVKPTPSATPKHKETCLKRNWWFKCTDSNVEL
ncbi:uncharacterized protein EAF02_010344 [Botrytis sinoallii]|uniref:uncharacterized protein n=1 Tax=Botrytis sinoallii TaxID=1463999 RepID=UPI0019005176|nr:uncharacterized protein EAF02_010344 [Botrytis sinoallii]KAF7862795.1 hypothetical protein EAF02_010344 [Botrytis sinoallii]